MKVHSSVGVIHVSHCKDAWCRYTLVLVMLMLVVVWMVKQARIQDFEMGGEFL